MMLLGDMKVDVVDKYSSLHDESGSLRLFRRKLLETDELDEVQYGQDDRDASKMPINS